MSRIKSLPSFTRPTSSTSARGRVTHSQLSKLAERSCTSVLHETLRRQATNDSVEDEHIVEYGKWLLLVSCRKGFLDSVQKLIAAGFSPNSCDEEGNTCLILASQCGHYDIVCHLLNVGSDPSSENSHGHTAFQFACESGHSNIAMVLSGEGPIGITNGQLSRNQTTTKTNNNVPSLTRQELRLQLDLVQKKLLEDQQQATTAPSARSPFIPVITVSSPDHSIRVNSTVDAILSPRFGSHFSKATQTSPEQQHITRTMSSGDRIRERIHRANKPAPKRSPNVRTHSNQSLSPVSSLEAVPGVSRAGAVVPSLNFASQRPSSNTNGSGGATERQSRPRDRLRTRDPGRAASTSPSQPHREVTAWRPQSSTASRQSRESPRNNISPRHIHMSPRLAALATVGVKNRTGVRQKQTAIQRHSSHDSDRNRGRTTIQNVLEDREDSAQPQTSKHANLHTRHSGHAVIRRSPRHASRSPVLSERRLPNSDRKQTRSSPTIAPLLASNAGRSSNTPMGGGSDGPRRPTTLRSRVVTTAVSPRQPIHSPRHSPRALTANVSHGPRGFSGHQHIAQMAINSPRKEAVPYQRRSQNSSEIDRCIDGMGMPDTTATHSLDRGMKLNLPLRNEGCDGPLTSPHNLSPRSPRTIIPKQVETRPGTDTLHGRVHQRTHTQSVQGTDSPKMAAPRKRVTALLTRRPSQIAKGTIKSRVQEVSGFRRSGSKEAGNSPVSPSSQPFSPSSSPSNRHMSPLAPRQMSEEFHSEDPVPEPLLHVLGFHWQSTVQEQLGDTNGLER